MATETIGGGEHVCYQCRRFYSTATLPLHFVCRDCASVLRGVCANLIRERDVLREAYRSLRMLRLDMWDGENLDASSVAIAAVESFDKEKR